MCLMTSLPLRKACPRAAAVSDWIVIVSRVPARASCCAVERLRSHSTPCCGLLNLLLTDTSYFCVDDHVANAFRPTRKLPPNVDRRVLGHPATSASECSPIATVLSLFCGGGKSHTARDMWSRFRPIRLMRVRSLPVLPSRLRGGILRSERDVKSVRREVCQRWWRAVIGVLPIRLKFFLVHWCVGLGGTSTRLWTRRLKSKLCHCQLCISWVCLPRQSGVAVHHTVVEDSFLRHRNQNPFLLSEPTRYYRAVSLIVSRDPYHFQRRGSRRHDQLQILRCVPERTRTGA